MLNFQACEFITSCPTLETRPHDNYPEVVFLGKSNVGKSTLINALVGQKIAFSSKKAGKTKLLNYFLIDKKFYLVDAPGYGYTAYGSKENDNFSTMMEGYFQNPNLKGALLLVDVRRGFKEDENVMIDYLQKLHLPFFVVFTKCDTVGQKERALALNEANKHHIKTTFFSGMHVDIKPLRSLVASLLIDA